MGLQLPRRIVLDPSDIDVDGQVRILLNGITDLSGLRIKNRFAPIPDVPLSEFNLTLAGGPRGILTPTRDLCRVRNNALLRSSSHNGERRNATLPVKVPCGKQMQRTNERRSGGAQRREARR